MMKTNENVKKVVFEWEYGPDDVSLAVGSYYYGKGIYIQMISYSDDRPEPFSDMTVNIPSYSLEPNEAFIDGDMSEDLLRFIQNYHLGEVLPFTGQSGYRSYVAVAFDLSRLREFDPQGVEAFEKLHGLHQNE